MQQQVQNFCFSRNPRTQKWRICLCLMIFPLLLFFGLFFSNIYPEIRAKNSFDEKSCEVIEKWSVQFVSGFSYRWYPVFNVSYIIEETSNETKIAQAYDTILSHHSGSKEEVDKYLKKFEIGSNYTCHVDPSYPDYAVFEYETPVAEILWTITLPLILTLFIAGYIFRPPQQQQNNNNNNGGIPLTNLPGFVNNPRTMPGNAGNAVNPGNSSSSESSDSEDEENLRNRRTTLDSTTSASTSNNNNVSLDSYS